MTARDPSFAIPGRPERTYSRSDGVTYEGETVFELDPEADCSGDGRFGDDRSGDDRSESDRTEAELAELVTAVLDAGPYQFGDFLDLPMVLYLVRDRETGDAFRVTVRDGTVRLHVLPETESEGLRRFYDRLVDRSDCDWAVACHTDVEG